jgi:hypothetical protein
MILKYCPPMIFAHRCYIERGENEMSGDTIKEKFGDGGNFPDTHHRWLRSRSPAKELEKLRIGDAASGIYYGFRTRDDQVMFYMLYEGQLKRKSA